MCLVAKHVGIIPVMQASRINRNTFSLDIFITLSTASARFRRQLCNMLAEAAAIYDTIVIPAIYVVMND